MGGVLGKFGLVIVFSIVDMMIVLSLAYKIMVIDAQW